MHTSLTDLKIGEKGRIVNVGDFDISPKYIGLGLIPGAEIEIKFKAPFGGPINLRILKNNVSLALRKADAKTLQIEKI